MESGFMLLIDESNWRDFHGRPDPMKTRYMSTTRQTDFNLAI